MLKINEKYYIDSDSLQYILMEKTIVQKADSKNYGKEMFKNIGYYGTLESLKKSLLEKEIKDNIKLLNNIDKIIELKNELKKVKSDE